jgi:hypothetical protein
MSATAFTGVCGREGAAELEEDGEEDEADCESSPANTAAATEKRKNEERAITKRTPPAIITSKNLGYQKEEVGETFDVFRPQPGML